MAASWKASPTRSARWPARWACGKLIGFYDDNGISIDGKVQGWFTDDTPKRFEAYGWHVIPNVDGHDVGGGGEGHPGRQGRHGQALPDLLQDHHRLGCSEQAGHQGVHGEALGVGRSRRRPQAAQLERTSPS